MFGRQLKASIAKDNGRSDEFAGQQRMKPTTDPNNPRRCFECGQEGHLSYECPKNSLGVRPLPAGKKFNDAKNSRKKKYDASGDEDDEADSLSAAIRYEVSKHLLKIIIIFLISFQFLIFNRSNHVGVEKYPLKASLKQKSPRRRNLNRALISVTKRN